MGFIELFFKRDKGIGEEDIQRFISQKIEESSNLDYKDIMAYENADALSTNISSFANSEGGLLILGISQDKIKDEKGNTVKIFPKEITWGKASLEKEWLENKLLTLIKPPINRLIITPVRNKKKEVIFLIDIPKSPNAPHMAPDHRYHRRINFRKRLMEHIEVANLFNSNWTMKEKLVETIYAPLASILELNAKQLEAYAYIYTNEINEILAKTYYMLQMPPNLLRRLEHYFSQAEAWGKKKYFARIELISILKKNTLKILKTHFPPLGDVLGIEFIAISNTKSQNSLREEEIFQILLENQRIENFLRKNYWTSNYKRIVIKSSIDKLEMDWGDFNEKIWDKCLEEVSANPKLRQFKKDAKSLSKKARNIINEVTEY
jgi:hypothetical protein